MYVFSRQKSGSVLVGFLEGSWAAGACLLSLFLTPSLLEETGGKGINAKGGLTRRKFPS